VTLPWTRAGQRGRGGVPLADRDAVSVYLGRDTAGGHQLFGTWEDSYGVL
jgi:hypothetical protein